MLAKIEEIVVLRTLERRFLQADLGARSAYALESRLLASRRAEGALKARLLKLAAPSETDLRNAYAERELQLRQPKRWRLADLYKAYPDGADPEQMAATRAGLAALRQRAAAGEDFATLAREESQSSTRARGGDMGFVTLERLAPPVAQAVRSLQPGDLSPLIELLHGLTLLRCLQVDEARQPTFEEARAELLSTLRNERVEAALEQIDRNALADLAPAVAPSPLPLAAEAVVASVQAGERRRGVTREELRLADPSAGDAPPGVGAALAALVRLEGRAREAERRGLLLEAEQAARARCQERQLRAQLAANEAASQWVAEPTEAELRQAFESDPRGWVEARRRKLRLLKLRLRPALPAGLYERARELARGLARSGGSLEEAAAALQPHAQLLDLGWLDDDGVWMLGLNLDAAVAELRPGGFSPLVQEGPALYVAHLEAERPQRRVSFDEARLDVRARLLTARRHQAGLKLRERLLTEQAPRLNAP